MEIMNCSLRNYVVHAEPTFAVDGRPDFVDVSTTADSLEFVFILFLLLFGLIHDK